MAANRRKNALALTSVSSITERPVLIAPGVATAGQPLVSLARAGAAPHGGERCARAERFNPTRKAKDIRGLAHSDAPYAERQHTI
jgi:hypothetical protein